MISSLMLTLLSGLGGAFTRMLPEVLNFFNKKTDNSHELALMDRQIQLEKHQLELVRLKGSEDRATAEAAADAERDLIAARGNDERQTLSIKTDHEEVLKLIDAQAAALKGQMQKTGNKWVDALNFLVRPLTTYYFLGCYGIVKTAMIFIAVQQADSWTAIVQCWDEADAAMLWGILNFWFVGRVIDKRNAK